MKRIIVSALVAIVILTQGVVPSLARVEASTPVRSDWTEPSLSTAATATSASGLEPVQSMMEGRYEVTLITGDVVIVSIMSDGGKALAISPAKSEERQDFWTMEKPTETGKNTYVVPGNVDLTKFDMELFNIDYLISEKYYGLSYLPVLVVAKPGIGEVEIMTVENQIAAIAESADYYPHFATTSAALSLENISNAYSTLTASSNIQKVWLDKEVHVSLSESVPLIGTPELWSAGYKGAGITVAILDTGIDDTHPDLDDLDDNPNTNDPKVLIEANFTGDPTADDGYGHGTHCASITAGTGATYTGVAPGAWLYNVKVLNNYGGGYESWIINGINFATLGPDGVANTGDEADIISMSLGGGTTDGTDPMSMAVDWAVEQGVVVVIAAGNSGGYYTVGAPGVAREVITVGATTKTDEIAGFSSRGPTIDYRVKPDVVAPGVNIVAARATGTSMGNPVNDFYTSASGTSMATPHVAGAAALILDANPVIPLGWQAPKFVKNTLMSNAVDLGYDIYTQGAGRISLPTSSDPLALVDPVTTSFGIFSENTTYNQTLTFYNLDSVSHELTLTPLLTEVMSSTNYSLNASLTPSVLTIPAGGSATTMLAVNTTGLPMGMYSGRVEAVINGGGRIQAIFGFSKMHKFVIQKTDMSGNPGVGHYVFAFTDNVNPMFYSSSTDKTGQATLYVGDGIYQVGSWSSDTLGQNATVFTSSQVTMPGTTAVTLDDRNTAAIDFDPNKSGQVIAEKYSRIRFPGVYIKYTLGGLWGYPTTSRTYVTPNTAWQSNYTYSYYPEVYYNPNILETPEWSKLLYGLNSVTGPVTFIADYNNLVTRQTVYKTALQDDEVNILQFAVGPPVLDDFTFVRKMKAPIVRTETLSPDPVSYSGLYYKSGKWQFETTPYFRSYPPGLAPLFVFGEHPFISGAGLYLSNGMLGVYGTVSADTMSNRFYNYARSPDGHLTIEQNGITVLNTDIDDYFHYSIYSTGTPVPTITPTPTPVVTPTPTPVVTPTPTPSPTTTPTPTPTPTPTQGGGGGGGGGGVGGVTTITIEGFSDQMMSTNSKTVLNFTADPNTNWRPPELICNVDNTKINLYNVVNPGDIPISITAIDPETGPGGVTSITFEYSLDDGATWNTVALLPGGLGKYLATLSIPEEKYVSLRIQATDNLGNSRLQQVIRGFAVSGNWLISPTDGSALAPGNITFTWQEMPGAIGYRIQIDSANTFDSPDLMQAVTVDNQYITNLDLGNYYWRVKGYVGSGETAYCTPWQLIIADPVVPITTNTGSDYYPAITQTSDGKLWVAWYSYRSGNANIWYKTSSNGGETWSADIQLTFDTGSDYDPAITRTSDGKVWVAWTSYRSGNADIWYKTSSNGGATWSAETQLTIDTGSDYDPAITQTSDGKVWVAWYSYRSGNPDIWYKTSSNGGATWSAETQLTIDTGSDYNPTITRTSDGKVWVAWTSYRSGNADIWYKTSSNGGATWSAETQLTIDTGSDYDPAITRTSDGKVWVAWCSYRSGNSDIWYKTSPDGGATWSADKQFTRFVDQDVCPGITSLIAGNVAFVWNSNRNGNYNIWFGIPGILEDTNPPPYVKSVWHTPSPNPDSDEMVTINAAVRDETSVTNAVLVYSVNAVPQTDILMYDDGTHGDSISGDGNWAIQLGPFDVGTQFSYRIRAIDSGANIVLAPSNPIKFVTLEPWTATNDNLLIIDSMASYYVQNYAPYYTAALNSSSVSYDFWDASLRGAPDISELAQYHDGSVIWGIPESFSGYLTATYGYFSGYSGPYNREPAITALKTYLDGGGELFITGNNIADLLRGNTFLSNYLHASYQSYPNLYRVLGVPSDPISDGLSLDLLSSYSTEIDPVLPAATVFTYDPSATQPVSLALISDEADDYLSYQEELRSQAFISPERGGLLNDTKSEGIQVQDISSSGTAGLRVDTGTYKLVYFAFGFESINDASDRAVTMERVMDWLNPSAPPPQLPCGFHGTVQVNGQAVADGTVITATIGNDTYTTTTGNSTYRIIIAQPEGKSYDGLTVTFMIGSYTASQTGIWIVGGNVALNLSVVAPEWSVPMTAIAGSEGYNTNLEFGTRTGATDGFDNGVDLPHPPLGPGATFDAYFSISHLFFPKLDRDYRAPLLITSDVRVWTLKVKSQSQQIALAWDASQIPSNLYASMDTGAGTIDMKAQNNLSLAAGEHTLLITVSYKVEFQLSLKAGWNMVSVPVIPADTSVSAVFPGAAAVFTWDAVGKGYIMPALVEPDTGYWVAVTQDGNITVTGVPVTTWTSDIKAGWNMIGSAINNASIANPNDTPDQSVQPFAYWWDPVAMTYVLTTSIEPGKGYWVASVRDCTLTVP